MVCYICNIENMQNDSATASYTYDGNGLRQSKNVNGKTTTYVYDGVNIIKAGDTYYSRGAAGLISANGNYYYTDYHGSVVRYGDSVYSYDAFGNEKSENTNDSNPFRYCGEYADSESGLVYLRARYYDSVIGAFVSEDPAKDGLNWYVYCSSDPVNYWDCYGLSPSLARVVEDNYKDKMTVTIAIRRPVENSNNVAQISNGRLDNGHTFLMISNGKGFVKYAGLNPSKGGLIEMLLGADVDSKVTDDRYENWNVAKVFEIEQWQFNAIMDYIYEVGNNGPKYNVESFNCTTFAVYALNRAGIGFAMTNITKKRWTLPDNMKEQLDDYKIKGKIPAGFTADYVKKLMGKNFGYTPADAAQDIKKSKGKIFLRYYGMNDNYKGYVEINN